jgi:hypothetical protein
MDLEIRKYNSNRWVGRALENMARGIDRSLVCFEQVFPIATPCWVLFDISFSLTETRANLADVVTILESPGHTSSHGPVTFMVEVLNASSTNINIRKMSHHCHRRSNTLHTQILPKTYEQDQYGPKKLAYLLGEFKINEAGTGRHLACFRAP